MTDSIVTPGESSVNGLDFEPDDEQDELDERFREFQMDAAIEAVRLQDAQVSRAETDWLGGRF